VKPVYETLPSDWQAEADEVKPKDWRRTPRTQPRPNGKNRTIGTQMLEPKTKAQWQLTI